MWPEESSSPDANKYLGIFVFCIILIPSWIILFIFLHRRNYQPIKGRLPMLSFLAQMCVLAHETYLCFRLLYFEQIPCGLATLFLYVTLLPAVDFYLARGYILYFVFHVTQERLALASEKLAHERAASQSPIASSQKDWETTQKDSSSLSRESTLKWFLRNRYRVQRPFLSACLVTVLFLQMIYPVINAVSARGQRAKDDDCGIGYAHIVLGIELAILIIAAIWIAVKLRNIHDAFFLKDELRLASALASVGVVVWMILINTPAVYNFTYEVVEVISLFLFLIEHSIFIVTTLVPLYRSFDPIMQYNQNDKNNDVDVEKLKQIIDMVPGFESFRAFVTREFSVQNLLFYVDVRDFHAKYDPNVVDATSQTKSLPTQPIPVVTHTARAVSVATTTPTAPASPSLAPRSPPSTSRDVGAPNTTPTPRAASMIVTTTSTVAAIAARASSGARSPSTISTTSSAILTTFPLGKKEKEKEEYTPQQLAEHNKRVLLTEANIQYEASRLFRKYIAFGAPLQVNLPDSCVTQLGQALGLNRDGSRARKSRSRPRARSRERNTRPTRTSSFLLSTQTVTSSRQQHSVSAAPLPRQDDIGLDSIDITVDSTPINYAMFNEAQQIILRLMAVDSFKRYKKSSDYEDLSRLIESDPLMKMGLGRL